MINTMKNSSRRNNSPEKGLGMHVAMVTVFPDDPRRIDGGVAGVARYLVEELKKHSGLKITVVALEGRAGRMTCEQWDDVTIHRVGKEGLWRFLPGTRLRR